MAIAEEAEKGSHGEGGGGRGTSTGSQRGADTSPKIRRAGEGGGIKRPGQRIDFMLESPISLYRYCYCFSHHKLQEIFYTIHGESKKWGF